MPEIIPNGKTYAQVRYCRTEVMEFANRWPGSQLPDCEITFDLARSSGDLLDISVEYDGADILALSEYAKEFLLSRDA